MLEFPPEKLGEDVALDKLEEEEVVLEKLGREKESVVLGTMEELELVKMEGVVRWRTEDVV